MIRRRKPLRRSTKPISRTKPIARKRAIPRRALRVICSVRGCKTAPRVAGMCLKHVKAECDRLWSLMIRARAQGQCELADWHTKPRDRGGLGISCGGALQANHGIPRQYLGTRWRLDNGMGGCAAVNRAVEWSSIEWVEELKRRWGAAEYEALRIIARDFVGPVDYEATLATLRSMALAFGIDPRQAKEAA